MRLAWVWAVMLVCKMQTQQAGVGVWGSLAVAGLQMMLLVQCTALSVFLPDNFGILCILPLATYKVNVYTASNTMILRGR